MIWHLQKKSNKLASIFQHREFQSCDRITRQIKDLKTYYERKDCINSVWDDDGPVIVKTDIEQEAKFAVASSKHVVMVHMFH